MGASKVTAVVHRARTVRPVESKAVTLPELPNGAAPTAAEVGKIAGIALAAWTDLSQYTKPLPGYAGVAVNAAGHFASEPAGFAVNGVTAAGLTQLGAMQGWYASTESSIDDVGHTIFQSRRAVDHYAMRAMRKVAKVVNDEKDPALLGRWSFLIGYLAQFAPPSAQKKAERVKAAEAAKAAVPHPAGVPPAKAASPAKKRAATPINANAVPLPAVPAANLPPVSAESLAKSLGVPLAAHIDTARLTRQVPGHAGILEQVAEKFAAEGPSFGVNGVTTSSLQQLVALETWFLAAEAGVDEALRSVMQARAAVDHTMMRQLRKIASVVRDEKDSALTQRWAFLIDYFKKFAGKHPLKVVKPPAPAAGGGTPA